MLINKIRESVKYVVENSRYVSLNEDKLNDFVKQFVFKKGEHWVKCVPGNLYEWETEKIINFLLILHSVGFSYWGEPKWEIEYNGRNYDGSAGMIMALIRAIESGKPILDFSYLSKLKEEDFKEILDGNIEIPLLSERLECIREVGNVVTKTFDNNFYKSIKHIRSDEELLEVIVKNFVSYNDIREYNGKVIYLYKRAQLLVSDILHILERKNNIKVDYSNLTACADYKIPQILRQYKLLEYSEELNEIINSKQEMLESNPREVEIRAYTIWTIDRIKQMIEEKETTAIDINDSIWIASQSNKSGRKPYHLVRTCAY